MTSKSTKTPEENLEEQKNFSEGKQLSDLVSNPGWFLAKRKLYSIMLDMDSIMGINLDDRDRVFKEVGIRQLSIQTILSWIEEIEGGAMQHSSYEKLLKDFKQDNIVQFFENNKLNEEK